ncbi:hypothetical protein DI09_42p10 [Mitosporidium daphniae]|uniref:Uncharacterized protein n=1 Tax=Mitosporidium daphniae TaxID=1485682 RepID=A0A098VQ50_9MICR|nr:uncharacterized protein DI09_42p10 [Mitosporidium daphniae]KGG51158.1 hypothetical protein DI09_42p10 [Mitosporidium daphniae]|eukprot:XP_013237610.1 uncharacterized protein DI09_42p10 [Mitosporidium daphniae]
MVLAGLSPSTILDVANRALSFWNYQARQQQLYLEFKITALNQALKASQNCHGKPREHISSRHPALPSGGFSEGAIASLLSPSDAGRRTGIEMPKNIPLNDHNLENVEAYWNAAKSPNPKVRFTSRIEPIQGVAVDTNRSVETNCSVDAFFSNQLELENDTLSDGKFPSSLPTFDATQQVTASTLSINGGDAIHVIGDDFSNKESLSLVDHAIDKRVELTTNIDDVQCLDVSESYFQLSFTSINTVDTHDVDPSGSAKSSNSPHPYTELPFPDSELLSPETISTEAIISNTEGHIIVPEEQFFEYEEQTMLSSTNSDSNENHYEDITEASLKPHPRRSNRRKYRPLEFWKNERVVYGRRESCAKLSLPAVLDVITYPEMDDSKASNKRVGTKRRRLTCTGAISSASRKNLPKKKILSLAHRLERLGFEEHKEVSGPVFVVNSDHSKAEISQSNLFQFS